jgi:hypothetical protein
MEIVVVLLIVFGGLALLGPLVAAVILTVQLTQRGR